MIAVDTLTRSISVKLAGAVTTNQASWAATYLTPTGVHATATGVTADATEVTIVPSPTGVAGGVNQLLSFSLWNKDTVQIIVTVTYKDSAGSDHILQSLALQTGESLTYEDKSGWSGLDANGNTKVASNNVNVSTALSLASQASSAASNLTPSVSANSASNSKNSVSVSAASSAASLGMLGSSQASSLLARWSITISKTSSSFSF